MLSNMIEIFGMAIAIIMLLVFINWVRNFYVRVSPDEVAIIVGKGKSHELRTSGFKKPFIEDVYFLNLSPVQVDVQTSDFIPTNDYIPIKVDSNVTVKIDTRGSLTADEALFNEDGTQIGIHTAVENFVGIENHHEYVRQLTRDILEGNLREIIGKMTLESIVTDRKEIAERVRENAEPDLEGLGLQIITFNIQNFYDETGVISKLGAENEEEITKKAELVKTRAEQEKSIARSQSKEKMHEAEAKTDLAIALENQKLELQKAKLQTERAKAQEEANAAKDLEKARQAKQIALEQAEVDKIQSETAIMIRENEAKANERIKIDNEFYAKLKEADGIRAMGLAEAEAIREKQKAMSEYSQADMQIKAMETLVKVSENLAKPLEKIGNVTLYGGGGDLMGGMTQTLHQLTSATKDSGFDFNALLTGAVATKVMGGSDGYQLSDDSDETPWSVRGYDSEADWKEAMSQRIIDSKADMDGIEFDDEDVFGDLFDDDDIFDDE